MIHALLQRADDTIRLKLRIFCRTAEYRGRMSGSDPYAQVATMCRCNDIYRAEPALARRLARGVKVKLDIVSGVNCSGQPISAGHQDIVHPARSMRGGAGLWRRSSSCESLRIPQTRKLCADFTGPDRPTP